MSWPGASSGPRSLRRDLDEDVASRSRIKASPFIPKKENVRGFVYDVHTDAWQRFASA
jgi:hypothetical protein